jgi:hypothetical protein
VPPICVSLISPGYGRKWKWLDMSFLMSGRPDSTDMMEIHA